MAKRSLKPHIHKYMRVIKDNPPGYTVFKCMIPGCEHWIRKELCLGRESICWVCGTAVILNMENLSLKKPRHFECKRSKQTEAV